MAKDTSWSWVILAMVTITVFLEIGTIKGFSVLLPDLKEQLSTDTWIIGSCISIISGWGYLLGLSASVLVKSFGPRLCLMISGLLASVGLIICAYATNVHILLVGLILTGFLVLQENAAIGIIPDYFDKHYKIAVNVYGVAFAIGIIISPIFTQLFLDIYGWRGALLMLSGLNLNSIPCCAILKQHKSQKTQGCETKTSTSSAKESFNNISLKSPGAICRAYSVSLFTSLTFIARVLVPGIVYGYTFAGWLIYIVSYALSNGASKMDASVVATCGGVGFAIIKIALPFLNKLMNYRQCMYVSSLVMTISLVMITLFQSIIGMSLASVIFGIGIGMLSTELYIAAKDLADEADYVNAIAWFHLFYGFAMILSGTLTGLIFDVTGSFTFSFTILAAVSLLTAISLGLEDIWARNNPEISR